MLILTFILLVACGVLSDATEDEYCNQMRPAHCYADEVEPVQFPQNIEALNKMCPVVIPRVKCAVDYLKECEMKRTRHDWIDDKLEIIYDITVEVCDKESMLHQELSRSLTCIENVLMNHTTCRPMAEEALDEVMSYVHIELDAEGNLVDEDDRNKYLCFAVSMEISCIMASTSVRCGDNAKNLLVEVFDRIQIWDSYCTETIYEEVKVAVAIIQLEMEKKIAIGDFVFKD